MLGYLVTSKTRKKLLEALWVDRSVGTVSSLARHAGTPVGASYDELSAMAEAGLARSSVQSGRVVYEANWGSPYAKAFQKLLSAPGPRQQQAGPDEAQQVVRDELSVLGAALWASKPNVRSKWPLEVALAKGCALSHHDPSVAKVMPHLLAQKKDELDFQRFESALLENHEKHTAGFFLAVAAKVTGDRQLAKWSQRLRDKRRTKLVDFTAAPTTGFVRQLADRNTPALAKRWNYRLNMGLEDFEAVFRKFAVDEEV